LSAQFAGPPGAAVLEQYRQWSVPESGFDAFFERVGPVQAPRAPSR
jgi:hypothetical protein